MSNAEIDNSDPGCLVWLLAIFLGLIVWLAGAGLSYCISAIVKAVLHQ